MNRHLFCAIFCAVAALCSISTARASFRTSYELDSTTFAKRVPITVSGYTGTSVLTNFPVLVKLAAGSPTGFDPAECAEDGSDLRFTTLDGKILPHEVDTWNAADESYIWVGIPVLTNETSFILYYGAVNPGPVSEENLWSLAGYAGVWHLTDGHDSTTNGLDGTIVSGVTATSNSKLGGALDFANTRMSVGTTPNSVLANGFSIEAWCYPRNRSTKAIFGKNTAMSVRIEDSSIRVTAPSVLDHDPANCSIAANEWFHLGLTFLPNPATDGNSTVANQYKVYRDGYRRASLGASRIPNLSSSDEMWIGGNKWTDQSFNGIIDEFRLSYSIRSADWIKAAYDTTASPTTFAELGAVEQANPDAPRIDVTAATVSHSDATFSVTLSNVSSETVVSVFCGPDFSTLTELTLGTLSADGTLTGTATGLGAATYVWYARATTTVAGVTYAIKSGRKDFTVTYAKEPSSSYKHFTATISYAGTAIAGVPVPIRISETAIEGFHYADVTETGFEFVDADGNILPWELDTWDTEGESVVWVKVPSYCEGAAITARYGGTFANARPAATGVWSGYTGVWHLGDLDATSSTYGSYPNSTATAGIDGEKAEASVADEKGVLGKSVMISQSTSKQGEGYKLGGVFVSDSGAGSPLDLGDTFAISGWFKHKDFDYYYDKLFGKRKKASNQESPNGAFAIEIGNNGSEHNVTACGAASNATKLNFKTSLKNSWSHIAFVYEGKFCRVYQNGSLIGTSAIVEVTNNNAPLCFGNLTGGYGNGTGDSAWAGWIDEVRLADGVLSAEYLAAEYDAVTNIVAFGSVVSVDMGDPRISAPVIERQQDGSFLVTAEISENEPAVGSVKCVVGGMEFAMTTSDASLPATYSAVVTGLPDGTYRATVRAQAEGGSVVARESTAVFYAGALVVTKVVDAEEATLSPGTFRISRADVDPTKLPALTFDVAFSGPGLAAIVEPTVALLTIPAGAASVDISVTPIYTTDVDADVALTLSVSGAFVGTPSSGSITIVNATYNPAVRYVATIGDDANHGGTPESPKKTIGAAIESLAAIVPAHPCTVHVAPGLYPITKPIVVTNAISVIGDDQDPSRVVVSNTVEASYYSQDQRIFRIDHAGAVVANLTMQKGQDYGHGGNFHIGSAGGTVSNCVVEAGYTRNNGKAGGAWLDAGVVTHTVFRKNKTNSASVWWNGVTEGVLHLGGNARAENCLFDDNSQYVAVTLVSVEGSAVLRNCSIVNTGLSSTNDGCSAWSALRIASSATVQNVVIAGVTNKIDGAACPPTGSGVAKFLNGAFDGDVTGLPEGTVVGTASSFFKDYANGDYTPKTGGPLVGKGANYEGMASVDLAGNPRKIGSNVDIGCYEGDGLGMIILVR